MGEPDALRRYLRALDRARRALDRDRLAGVALALDAALGLAEDLDPEDRRGHGVLLAEVAARFAAAAPPRLPPGTRRTRGTAPLLVWVERAHVAAHADRLVALLGKPEGLAAAFAVLRDHRYPVGRASQVGTWRRTLAGGRAPEEAVDIYRRLARGAVPVAAGRDPAEAEAFYRDRLAAVLRSAGYTRAPANAHAPGVG